MGDFPGGLVVKTPRSQCKGHGSSQWELRFHMLHSAGKEKKKTSVQGNVPPQLALVAPLEPQGIGAQRGEKISSSEREGRGTHPGYDRPFTWLSGHQLSPDSTCYTHLCDLTWFSPRRSHRYPRVKPVWRGSIRLQ